MKLFSLFLATALATAAPAFAEESLPQPEPIRQAKVKITVQSGYLAESDLLKERQNICELSEQVPVYAPVADPFKVSRQYANFLCHAEVNGETIQVQVSGAVYLDNATANTPAKKSLRVAMFVQRNGEMFASQASRASTTDLSAKNLELMMSSASYDLAEIKEGTPAFTVFLTMDDAN